MPDKREFGMIDAEELHKLHEAAKVELATGLRPYESFAATKLENFLRNYVPDILAFMEENKRLWMALAKYGRHARTCPVSVYNPPALDSVTTPYPECSCGYSRALENKP